MWVITIRPRFILFFILNIITAFGVLSSASAIAENHENDTELLARQINAVLTPEEKSWLRDHQTIQIAGPRSFPPFHYFERDGVLKGISADYIHIIMKSLGVRVEIQKDLLWPEVLKRAQARELDLISCIAITADREAYLRFSKPYLSFPLVILNRQDAPFIGGLSDLHRKKVAIIKGVSTYKWLMRDKIDIIPFFVNSPLEGLEAVSFGQADAYIGNLAAASYLIKKNGLTNIKIAAPTPYGNYNLHFAVRKDWPELVSIINKTLDVITAQQHSAIRDKSLTIQYEHGIQMLDILKWILFVVLISTIILMVFLIWNRRLKKEITERKEAEKTAKKSELKLRAVLDATPFPVALVDVKDNIINFWSRSANTLFGQTAPTTSEWYELAYPNPDYRNEIITRWKDVLETAKLSDKTINTGEYEVTCRDGSVRTCELYATFLTEELIVTFNDITENKQAEDKIQASLIEKETLLQEIHHRVKNNMQVIVSLLDLQTNGIENKQVRDALRESKSRVQTMAAVHETLHESDKMSDIDLQSYISKIIPAIFNTYSIEPGRVTLNSDVQEVPISISQASPLGLIINELISNSLKYAFPDDRKGEITITMKKADKELELTVMDDGVGMPEGLEWRNSNSLGLKLICSLTENQLGGSVEMERNNGTKFTIKFNVEA